jgi:hypothetical protein
MEEIWPEVHKKNWKIPVFLLNITFNFLCVYEAYIYILRGSFPSYQF